MTHPTAIWRLRDNTTVEHGQDDGAGEGADAVAPTLAAIQNSYEEAKANIVDPAPPWPSPADGGEPLPATEKIDLRGVTLPTVPDGTRGTEAMSVAAKFLAEQQVVEQGTSPASGPAPDASSAAPAGRRGWWRGIRTALHGVDGENRPEP